MSEGSDLEGNLEGNDDAKRIAPEEQSKPRNRRHWGVFVYLSGDNNLSEEMVWSLQEMRDFCRKRSTGDSLHLIAQFDPVGDHPRTYDFTESIRSAMASTSHQIEGELETFFAKALELDDVSVILRRTALRRLLEPVAVHQGRHLEELVHETEAELAKYDEQEAGRDPERRAKALAAWFVDKIAASNLNDASSSALRQSLRRALEEWAGSSGRSRGAAAALIGEFIKDQMKLFLENAPAEHLLVVLSGHGSGATGAFLSDDDPRGSLTIPALREVLERAKRVREKYPSEAGPDRISILGFESCAMSTLEVSYEVREYADYILATEGLVRNTGWPYQTLLEPLLVRHRQYPEATLDVAREMADAYARFYDEYRVAAISTDIQVLDLSRLRRRRGSLVHLIKAFAKTLNAHLSALRENEEVFEAVEVEEAASAGKSSRRRHPSIADARALRDALIVARWNVQSYNYDRYVDLVDFCAQLIRALRASGHDWSERSTIIRQAEKISVEARCVVRYSAYQGPEYQHSHGFSIYFPAAERAYESGYGQLQFSLKSGWHKFLQNYLQKTRRSRRHEAQYVLTPKGRAYESRTDELWVYNDEAGDEGEMIPVSATARTGRRGNTRLNLGDGVGDERDPTRGYGKNTPKGYYRDTPRRGSACRGSSTRRKK